MLTRNLRQHQPYRVGLVNLLHFSQGWVQFGYRFSLDFAPWALLLVAIGLERIATRTGRPRRGDARDEHAGNAVAAGRIGAWAVVGVALALVAVSVFVNFWGVVWGDVLGW